MAIVAPWEDPNLPTPYAQVEREIEGRTRRFALWRWDERLVWSDVDHPYLWWATLDYGHDLAEWERAIVGERFGRAFTHQYRKIIMGKLIGFPPSCRFELERNFYVVDEVSGGIAREVQGEIWYPFERTSGTTRRQSDEQALSIWHIDRRFYGRSRALVSAFAVRLLERFSLSARKVITTGEDAPPLKLMRDWVAWSFHQDVVFEEFMRVNRTAYGKMLAYFDLPAESLFRVSGGQRRHPTHLMFSVQSDYQRWEVRTEVPLLSTAHELLELQLRLRDALRPILTATEIEGILAPDSNS